jgi:hypothetical protein
MHREHLMRPDLLSEIILLGFGGLMLASVALFILTALARNYTRVNFSLEDYCCRPFKPAPF